MLICLCSYSSCVRFSHWISFASVVKSTTTSEFVLEESNSLKIDSPSLVDPDRCPASSDIIRLLPLFTFDDVHKGQLSTRGAALAPNSPHHHCVALLHEPRRNEADEVVQRPFRWLHHLSSIVHGSIHWMCPSWSVQIPVALPLPTGMKATSSSKCESLLIVMGIASLTV